MNTSLRVSDIITNDEIDQWKSGDVITIRAKTGDGKSYFVKNRLYEYAKQHNKKILFLLHRENTIEQFQEEVERDGKTDVIHIRTYQYIEQLLLHERKPKLDEYGYIVVDEAHYFISDSAFNNKTDLSFDAIISATQSVRIFMSATINDIHDYINTDRNIETKDYELPQSYNHISKLMFYNKDDMLDEIAKQILDNGEKGIFFINKARKAYDFYKRFRGFATFNCSKSNALYRYVNEGNITRMLTNERFDTPLLITTSCLDAGVNIVDTEVRHIVIDMKDSDTVIQCAGRKRAQSYDDTFSLYIKEITNQQLGGYESAANRKLQMARYLMDHTTEELIKQFPRQNDAGGVIYDVTENGRIEKRVNQLKFRKKQKDIELYGRMKNLGEHGFAKYMAQRLGFFDGYTGEYDYQVARDDSGIRNYLNRMLGIVMLGRTDRKELIGKLDIRQDGHQLRGIDSINAALRERQLPYQVKEFSTSRRVNGKKKNYNSAWVVEKVES